MDCRTPWVVLAVVVGLLSSGCGVSLRPEDSPPPWLVRLPVVSGALYAVGVSGPTYFATDAIKRASDHAREELAKSLGGKIQSVTLVDQSERGTGVQHISATEATSWAMDVAISSSQIIATWVDVHGVYQDGKPGTTYALGVLEYRALGGAPAEVGGSGAGSPGEEERLREEIRKRLLEHP